MLVYVQNFYLCKGQPWKIYHHIKFIKILTHVIMFIFLQDTEYKSPSFKEHTSVGKPQKE